ncbi:MAG: GNAT family N-acetyltransferase [Beijerinckiaceae bacterium]
MIGAPVLLEDAHDCAKFSCGTPALDEWLQRRALANQSNGASRTYVVCDGARVAGYYALANGGVLLAEAPGRIRRNMPEPVPVMLLARLAIDRDWQGKGLGADLLQDAVLRTMQAAHIAGIRALLVHARDDKAASFYRRFGFIDSPIRLLTLFLSLHPGGGG